MGEIQNNENQSELNNKVNSRPPQLMKSGESPSLSGKYGEQTSSKGQVKYKIHVQHDSNKEVDGRSDRVKITKEDVNFPMTPTEVNSAEMRERRQT